MSCGFNAPFDLIREGYFTSVIFFRKRNFSVVMIKVHQANPDCRHSIQYPANSPQDSQSHDNKENLRNYHRSKETGKMW